jgi:hypothetical protein
MIVKVMRPRADHRHWEIIDREGRVARFVARDALPPRVATQAIEAEATYWFASLDPDSRRMVIHDPVPPQGW